MIYNEGSKVAEAKVESAKIPPVRGFLKLVHGLSDILSFTRNTWRMAVTNCYECYKSMDSWKVAPEHFNDYVETMVNRCI